MAVNRRRTLALLISGFLGFSGCRRNADDDFDPQLAEIRITNLDSISHTATIQLFTPGDSSEYRTRTPEYSNEITLQPDESEVISAFDGRAKEYILEWEVEGRQLERVKTGRIDSCLRLSVTIESDDEETDLGQKTICEY